MRQVELGPFETQAGLLQLVFARFEFLIADQLALEHLFGALVPGALIIEIDLRLAVS